MIKQILETSTFFKYFEGSIEDLEKRWSEPHRYYHTLDHLKKIVDQIDRDKNDLISSLESDILKIAAIYHDIVYLPREDKYNIADSIEKFQQDFPLLPSGIKNIIRDIIDSTNYHDFNDSDKMLRMFNSYDMNGILNGTLEELIKDGDNVAKEYHLEKEVYKVKRIEFLENYKQYNPNIEKCIEYLRGL